MTSRCAFCSTPPENRARTRKRSRGDREKVDAMPAERQFDFWLGEWDCRWHGGHGTNVVTAELDGAVILERFESRSGTLLRGISVSVYDGPAEEWRQTCVDSTRAYLEFVGGIRDGEMELRRAAQENGRIVRYRMRFTDVQADGLVWLWERRNEDGGEWELQWRIDYSRR
jgi:hypothetical protein